MTGPERHFDLAIVGAGVSGLCLAQALLDGGEWSILLVDGARDDDRLKTISFWSEGPTVLEALVRHRWKALAIVGADHRAHTVQLERHTYQTLYFADLQRVVKARLAADSRHRVVEGLATAIEADDQRAQLTVGDQTFTADLIFDSRFHAAGLEVDTRRFHLLWQRFHGLVVRTAEPAFDPGTATFIDFRVELPRGTGFAYLLPYSPREALVELVSLGPQNDGPALIRAYLDRCHGVRNFEVMNTEGGASPMTDQPFEPFDGPRLRRIGTASGGAAVPGPLRAA
jgi:lycopene beta-cyclase